MAVLRTLLASACVAALGGVALAAATDGFQAFTTETARRLAVREQPVVLPAVELETQTGARRSLADFRGQWLLVDFIYTRCPTYCVALGSEFAQLQGLLATLLEQDRAALLSISFDPAHDTPARLAAYIRRSGGRGESWVAARPVRGEDLRALKQGFGVTVIPDAFGGYTHNAAIELVDPQGRLVAVLDPGEPERVAAILRRKMAQ